MFSGRHLRPLPGDHQVVSKAVVIATGVAADGSREVLMRDERPTALSMDFARPSRSEPRADAIGGLEVRPEVGEIKSLMDRRYELGEVPDALRCLEEPRARGKVVITL